MNLTNPHIASAAAVFIAIEAVVPMVVARNAAPTRRPSGPVVRHMMPDDLDALAERSRQGDAKATFEYARRIELGLGTRRDAALAAYWYQVAEEQGYQLPKEVVERMFP